MPVPTPELGLQRGVDTDDTADYLTISLANSLSTVDTLFNNVTGHTHNGAHQGGPIVIPAGSITSAMIADGNVTYQKLGQISNRAESGSDGNTYTRTGPTNAPSVVPGPTSLSFTSQGNRSIFVWVFATMSHSVAASTINLYLVSDGGFNWVANATQQVAGLGVSISGLALIDSSPGHTFNFQMGWDTGTPGTLSKLSWMNYFYAEEIFR